MIKERGYLLLNVLLVFLLLQCNRQETCGCSAQSAIIPEDDIHQTVRHYSWNWLVSLRDTSGYFCHGSIISERYIITAAHCLQKTIDPLSSITICIGTDRCEEQYAIDNFIRYPSYNDQTFENDIALIRVRMPFNFTDGRIARICLPDEHRSKIRDVITVNWNARKREINRIQQMRMQIVDESTNTYSVTRLDHRVQLCPDALKKGTIVSFDEDLAVSFVSFR